MAKKSLKREIIEWVVIISLGAALFFTGYHTEVIGQIQRVLLSTGIMKPDIAEQVKIKANYDLTLTTFDGNPVSFESFRNKTVFINFWATWCPPCIAEMPDIHSLYEKVGDEVVFVMISLDENKQKARDYIARKEYQFPVYFLGSNLPEPYNPSSIPTTYVISPEGDIVVSKHGMAKYDTDVFIDYIRSFN